VRNLVNQRQRIIYIMSPSYSGSTLLTLLLASHPRIATIGELKATSMGNIDKYRCSCDALIRECSYWQDVKDELVKIGINFSVDDFGTHFRSNNYFHDRLLHTRLRGQAFEFIRESFIKLLPACQKKRQLIINKNRHLIEIICKLQEKEIFLDGSKDSIRLKHFLSSNEWDIKVINLLRDGRGIANSLMKHQNVNMEKAANEWKITINEITKIKNILKKNMIMDVRYEDLCQHTEKILDSIFDFIEIERMDSTTALNVHQKHILGNPMRLNTINKIKLDEKWKYNLSQEELSTFDKVAGKANNQLGYLSA